MANRQERRRQERAFARQMKDRGTPSTPKPTGDHGVEVDRGEDGFIYFTLYGGYLTLTVKWSERDAEVIEGMLREAREGKMDAGVEVVHKSGIVVPPKDFKL